MFRAVMLALLRHRRLPPHLFSCTRPYSRARRVQENARLKRIVAERDLEIDAMKDLLSKKW